MFARTARLFAAAFFVLVSCAGISSYAQTATPVALSGKVSSAEEGLMEGVVVRAKQGIVTVSVVSDGKGEFSFPASKLRAGAYTLSIRASGYDLAGPSSVTLAGAPVSVDLKLTKTKNIAAQLSNLEWILSAPGTERQKSILSRCVNCHTLERVIDNKHDAAAWKDVIRRMATYSNNSFHLKPQVRKEARDMNRFVPNIDEVAAYLASINRSAGDFTWQPKPMPRVSGSGTRVVITEYALPDPTIQPHDVIVDSDGIVWHSDFSGQILGRFDTKTLTHRSYKVPLQREGWPTGALDLQPDPQGNLWLGLMFQAGAAKFDRKTETFQMVQLPPDMLKPDSQQAMVGVQNWTVDNRIWLQDPARRGIYRMDLTNGRTELFEPFKTMPRSSPYGVFSDKQNNVWFLNFGGEHVGTINAKSGEITLYPTPTPRSRPRRGRIDDQGRIWFAEFGGERVGVFDPKSKQFKEWQIPGRYFSPYDVTPDRLGNIWTGGMNADRILRISTESGEITEYPLPQQTNIRRVFVDNNTSPPTFWIGNNHGATLIKLEPLD